ncbi:MAG: phenylalanine--tRNA ligase subunit alpha [Patescibacteria group bacterium]|nr:phenylalanine--tRNA ligase subunit alpha [Patescibacteria group bacterium]
MDLELELNNLLREIENKFREAKTLLELENLRIRYLGRKSYLASFPQIISKLDQDQKKKIGKIYNDLKARIEKIYGERKEELNQVEVNFDFEHPGLEILLAKEHPISKVRNEIVKIFSSLGFSVVDYSQIVSEEENFDYLNIPAYHPARDIWDTIWVDKNGKKSKYLFRTHTTSFQVSTIKKLGVPLRAVVFGKVFRYEATDKTHDFEFHQLDGISISPSTNLGHLRYVVEKFFESFFDSSKAIVRFRPGYFPFVEPGLEIDIGCIFCHGKSKNCLICKNTRFIEVAGAGMIHPHVLIRAGVNANKYRGYAFGFGVDRLIMLRHSIDDIRVLHSADLRFINQF